MTLLNFRRRRPSAPQLPPSALEGYSIEVMPRTAAQIGDFRALLPESTRIYIAHIDGTPIDADIVGPFFDARLGIAAALVVPLGVAAAAIFVIAMFRLSLAGLFRSLVRRPQ